MKITGLYPAGRVRRFHTTDLPGQTVGHHSWGVALIVSAIYPKPHEIPGKVLLASLTHDCAEVLTGDMPSPIQREYPELSHVLAGIERRFNLEHGIEYDLTDRERAIIKWADMFECLLFAEHAYHLGISQAFLVMTRAKQYLKGLGYPTTEARELFYEIIGE